AVRHQPRKTATRPHEAIGPPSGDRLRQDYQITIRFSPSRAIGCPGLHEYAAANAGRLDGAPIARKFAGACESVARRTPSSCSVKLRRHTVAQLAKKRWSRLMPPVIGSAVPAVAVFIASNATARPPRSAMFSPSVSLPLTFLPGSASYWLNWPISWSVSDLQPLASDSVHQFSKLPVGPKRLPWSW